jgi:hypothetical protein
MELIEVGYFMQNAMEALIDEVVGQKNDRQLLDYFA